MNKSATTQNNKKNFSNKNLQSDNSTKKNRKVVFTPETKKHDGSSKLNILFANICLQFFNNKVHKIKDILIFTKNVETVKYFIEESKIIIRKLEKLKKELVLENKHKILLNCKRFNKILNLYENTGSETDQQWDNPILEFKSCKYARKGVSLLRNGGCISCKLYPEHIIWLDQLILLFEATEKYLTKKEKKIKLEKSNLCVN
jgi:hypothetical protein